jgi:hypothetical protein
VNALANKEVGAYLDKHFVCSFQKIGTFRLVNGTKQGGNVASYFCTPSGNVLDAIAGPVDAATMLREARWVVETRKMALLASRSDLNRYKVAFRLAHAERLPSMPSFAAVNWQHLPLYQASATALASVLKLPAAQGLSKQERVHLLLAIYPLVKLDQAYPVIYGDILGEKVSAVPVTETGGSSPPARCRPQVRVVTQAGSPQTWGAPRRTFPNWFAPDDTPAPQSRRERIRAAQLNYARHDPPDTEVWSGRTLNILLADLEQRQTQNVQEALVKIAAELLKHINLTSGRHGANLGPLKDGGKLRWPLAWDEPPIAKASQALRKSTASSIREAIARRERRQEVGKLLVGARGDVNRLRVLLKSKVNDLAAADYLEAKHYLGVLDDALRVLGRPDAVQYLKGSFAPDPRRVKTVADLVEFMAGKGLRFAPANPGDEATYTVLQRALARADDSTPALTSAGPGDL